MSPEVLSKLVNLLSFAALGLTVLLIIRIRLEGQVRAFGLQSFVLALLSALIALYSGSLELLGVAVRIWSWSKSSQFLAFSIAPWRTSACPESPRRILGPHPR